MKKILMYVANRIWLILSIYLISLLLGALMFMFAEGKDFSDGLWWASVTALTVGYGDLSPVTPIGRVGGVLFGHFWIFVVIPMIIANIILHLVEDHNAFTDAEQRELMERLVRVETMLERRYGPEQPIETSAATAHSTSAAPPAGPAAQ